MLSAARRSLGCVRMFTPASCAGLFAFLLFVGLPVFVSAQSARHPLDGLTASEYWSVLDTLRASGHADPGTRYPSITLREPAKDEVLRWKPGQSLLREAFVVVKQGAKTFEASVDIAAKKMISWKEIPGVQANLLDEETIGVSDAVKENPEWRAGMKRRGITDYSTVVCFGNSPGYFGTAEEQGRRLLRIVCMDRRNVWEPDSRPIEGLVVVWDANEKKAVRVIDTGVVPVPRAPADYDVASVGALREVPTPISVQQPLGPSFRVEGQEVSWQKWSFHFRIDRRLGLIVSNVRYADGDKLRSILYEGSLSEIFVPYMDPSEDWYWASYFDPGEFANGFSSPLQPGADCPENAVYFDQVYADDRGMPQLGPRAVCLFERYSGDMAWRHTGHFDPIESRKRRDLVLRTIGTFGNYDYAFDWVFRQDGTIQVAVGATGIDELKGVIPKNVEEDRDGRAEAYGRFVAENTVAPDHDHYFSFRLDFDVDGVANSFVRDHLQVERLPAGSARKSVWVAKPEIAKTEKQAKLQMSMEQPEIWRVINPNAKSALGHPVGYEIMPGENAMSLMLPEDYPQRRAGFIDYQLWVTPFRENERYAAGAYPTQSHGGDGLPAWTKADRPIENTDIVLWYTMGFHHVPHSEDFPVMPTVWHEFELRPYNFFSRNPAVDLPK